MVNSNRRPGLAAGLDFRDFPVREEAIAHQFANVFRLNFARVQSFKGKKYCFVLARPTDTFLERYLLEDRELLILFSPDKAFDGRLFDFVDFLNYQYRNRIDRLCMILVADDDELENRVEAHVRSQTEARLIIPIPFSSADHSLGAHIEGRLNQFLFGRDLFAFSSPLKTDAYFFGRAGTLQFLYEKYRNGENAGLFGLRKVGKTSVLHALQRWLDSRDEPSVLIDCQDSAVQLRKWNELLLLIIERLIGDLNLAYLKSLATPSRYEEKNASRSFEADLESISHHFEGKRVLLMFDEIESITFSLSSQEHWRSGKDFLLFWQTIRAIYQGHSDLFSFVITGVNPKAIETATVANTDNPIFRIVTPTYLEFFNHDDVDLMVTQSGRYMGLKFEPQVISDLTQDFGGHPFLVRQACSSLQRRVPKRPATVDRYLYAEVRAEVERELWDYVDQIVSVLKVHYGVEYELLETLAIGDKTTFNEWAAASPSMIDHLRGYGLVTESYGSHHITIRCVAQFLISASNRKAIVSEKEQRQQEVSQSRNKLEGALRKVVRLVLRTRYGAEEGKRVLLKAMLKHSQQRKMEKLPFDELFNSNERELYLLDLQRVVVSEWSLFQVVFGSEKQRFEQFLELVNRNRIDAHDKDISKEDLVQFQVAANWIISKCEDYLGVD